MLGKVFDKILHEDEDLVEKVVEAEKKIEDEISSLISSKDFFISIIIFLVALGLRLYSLFYITDPQNAGVEVWYSDAYHHWQIAYLTKTVGLKEGFLRLWDLKGLEYFWGAAHPLIGSLLIAITGSTSIVSFRIFSSVMGAIAIVFLYLIVRRHWGIQAGLAAALLGMLSPVGIFSDASGMVEPLGIAFFLAGIYFFPKRAFFAGFLLAMASMARAEFWLLSSLVLFGALLLKTSSGKKPFFFLGYIIPIVLYMKYLLDWTGNPIYPIWWNFVGNAVGAWQADIAPNLAQIFIQKVYWVIAGVSLVGIFITLLKRPKHTLFFLFGFGNWLMWGIFIGMTKYLLSYLPRFWLDRIMLWPYLFAGALIAIFLFSLTKSNIPRILKIALSVSGWVFVVLIIIVSQFTWTPIRSIYNQSRPYWNNFREIASQVGKLDTGEGKVLIPEDWPPLTYMLVHFEDITGERIVGQMFDPFFYIGDKPFDNWGENRKVVLDWFRDEDIRLLFFKSDKERYIELVEREPEFFEELVFDSSRGLYFYKVNQEKLKGAT